MKRKRRVERPERRRPMPEIDLNESADRKGGSIERPGFAQMFGQIRSKMRPGQTPR